MGFGTLTRAINHTSGQHVALAGALVGRMRTDTSNASTDVVCGRLNDLARTLHDLGSDLIEDRRVPREGIDADLVGMDVLTLSNACALARDLLEEGLL